MQWTFKNLFDSDSPTFPRPAGSRGSTMLCITNYVITMRSTNFRRVFCMLQNFSYGNVVFFIIFDNILLVQFLKNLLMRNLKSSIINQPLLLLSTVSSWQWLCERLTLCWLADGHELWLVACVLLASANNHVVASAVTVIWFLTNIVVSKYNLSAIDWVNE